MILIGILAAVALPRLSGNEMAAVRLHDEALAALRYAQKTATSHRRTVCASFGGNQITFAIANSSGAACATALPLPGASSSTVSSSDSSLTISGAPSSLQFLSDGRIQGSDNASRWTIVAGGQNINLIGASGLVY